MSLNSSQIKETFYNELAGDSQKRFQKLFSFYCTINIVPTFPIDRYVRSSKELIRMANIYFEEKDYLHSFVLYSRFIILLLEKIKIHPKYETCDKTQLSPMLKQAQSIAFPRAEKLKKYIKDVFLQEEKEYKQQLELSKKLAGTYIEPESKSSIKSLSPEEFEELKQKYNTDNEHELELLKEKELKELSKQNESTNEIAGAVAPPAVNRNLKPKTPGENSYKLRTIHLPSDLIECFLKCAMNNTSKNVETCGFLAGKLSNNEFVVSNLIIPKQTGTSDTCNTTEEMELFDTIDKLNLITLGWIHTHPSQTAFLSSVDLHTQFGFQIMIPEAVAIVCAPSYKEYKNFILTPDYGMKQISDCNQTGFHMHQNNPPIFEECDHVHEDTNLKVQLVDLRS